MHFPEWLAVVIGVAYIVNAAYYWAQGLKGFGLMYFAYGLANAGIVWAAIEMRRLM